MNHIEILYNIGLWLDLAGKLIVIYAAFSVHLKMMEEHKIDKKVFDEIVHEKYLVWLGIVLLVVATILKMMVGHI